MKHGVNMIVLVLSLSLCSCDTARQKQTNHVLDAVVIPELDFRDADLWNAISFLDAMSVYPDAPSQDSTGVLHPVLEMGYTNLVAGDRFDHDALQKLPGLTVCTRNSRSMKNPHTNPEAPVLFGVYVMRTGG